MKLEWLKLNGKFDWTTKTISGSTIGISILVFFFLCGILTFVCFCWLPSEAMHQMSFLWPGHEGTIDIKMLHYNTYRKTPSYLGTRKIAVIILKFE